MDVRNLLTPQRVGCRLAARSRKHALDIVSGLFARDSGGALDATEIFDAMISRERLGCTALGNGVAMPHARISGIEAPMAAFVRLAEPVDFDTPDDRPVELIFALLVPAEREACQSEELAELSRIFADAEFRRQLRAARSARALYELFPAAPLKAAVNA
ncbi:MAG: PTS sugar transporter subunit IIA [Gammaproteobacteria bacterium]|nr:PTS sugar transporter subunit IIA [Gammaproteobacteria bacterium]